jgi:hypothetical protein
MLQAVEKLVLSKLLVEGSNRRIFNVDHHAGMVSTQVAAQPPAATAVLQQNHYVHKCMFVVSVAGSGRVATRWAPSREQSMR